MSDVGSLFQSLWDRLEDDVHDFGTLRVGIDLVEIDTLARQLAGPLGVRFGETIFTEQERSDCRDRVERYATRWAVKEAVAKAIGTGFRSGLRPVNVEVVTSLTGAISVRPTQDTKWPNGAERWKWAVSASHEADFAAAIAVATAIDGERRQRE